MSTEQALVEELARVTEERESLTEQRDNLLRIIRHMRHIALPYPQWEAWWVQLGGEVVAVERTLAEQEEGNE